MASPPPSLKRSGWPGTAWQEEHPPALNAVSPLARFGRWNGSVTANAIGVAVSHQNTPKAAAATMMAARKIRRDIHRSVSVRFDSMASMAAIPAVGSLKIWRDQARHGNKTDKSLFRIWHHHLAPTGGNHVENQDRACYARAGSDRCLGRTRVCREDESNPRQQIRSAAQYQCRHGHRRRRLRCRLQEADLEADLFGAIRPGDRGAFPRAGRSRQERRRQGCDPERRLKPGRRQRYPDGRTSRRSDGWQVLHQRPHRGQSGRRNPRPSDQVIVTFRLTGILDKGRTHHVSALFFLWSLPRQLFLTR